jgi:hypothetical protein
MLYIWSFRNRVDIPAIVQFLQNPGKHALATCCMTHALRIFMISVLFDKQIASLRNCSQEVKIDLGGFVNTTTPSRTFVHQEFLALNRRTSKLHMLARVLHTCGYIALASAPCIFIKKNSVVLVRKRTIPTERPQPAGEVSANFS